MKILNVVGARPNFMKIAPLMAEMQKFSDQIEPVLVHTGQHYDERMSQTFFTELGIPHPDVDLEVGSGSHAVQTGTIMIRFEELCTRERPDVVLVVGDVNSTMACTITAKKMQIPVVHVEAGLRSGDMSMPEEINRLCTDVLCDYLYTTDHFANENLRREGIAEEKIVFVGNVMIDTLLTHLSRVEDLHLHVALPTHSGHPGENNGYGVLTLHRPANVDDPEILADLLTQLAKISQKIPLIFPAHPRTVKTIKQFGLESWLRPEKSNITVLEPLGYLQFLRLNRDARLILTDSGGIQEEATILEIPCLTLRTSTERPITCEMGSNVLIGRDMNLLHHTVDTILAGQKAQIQVPPLWDGKAAERIVRHILSVFS